jgi:hypothetical protein
VLLQLIPLGNQKRQYELSYVYRTHGIAENAGLGLRISDAQGGAIVADGPGMASEAEQQAHIVFEAHCPLVRLALRYRRAPGTTRTEGFVALRSVGLRPLFSGRHAGKEVKKDDK